MLPFELTVKIPAKTKKAKAEKKKVTCFAIDIIKGRETKVKFYVYDGSFLWIDSELCEMTETQLKNCL